MSRAGKHMGVPVLPPATWPCNGTNNDRDVFAPVLLATVLERLSAHLEVLRDHPLTTRRYYKQLEY